MGRRKIEIQPLNDDRNRTVTFVKRKAGLFKKAYELSVLCKVDLAVIIVGNNNKVYEFSSVDTKELMDHYSKQKPHESKSPENYGRYKKKAHLPNSSHSMDDDSANDMKMDDTNGDSDYESDVEPTKKRKISSSIYGNQPAVPSGFPAMNGTPTQLPKKEPEAQPVLQQQSQQRPVLRVQIPSDAKTSDSSTVTPNEGILKPETQANAPELQQTQPPPLNSARYVFGKFKSPDSKRPQLPKSQTSSPSSASVPQLPMNPAFFSSLPQPSPSGQYPPSILPTPVFNQVFNQQYMGQFGPMGAPSAGVSGANSAIPTSNGGAGGQIPPSSQNQQNPQEGSSSGNSNGAEGDGPRFKPPFQQHLNGEQTPVSGLPSRYMSDIFPSPSNLYPAQEWPTSMTPYSSNMSHYFGNIPSSNGTGPPTVMYPNSARPQMAQRPGSGPTPQQNTSNPQQPHDQQSSPTAAQEYIGHYYKK